MGRLDGRVVVVTGGARGEPAAAVEALAREGATVYAADVMDETGDTVAQRMADAGLPVDYVHVDVGRTEDWRHLAALIAQRHGQCDALVTRAAAHPSEAVPPVTLAIAALMPLMPPGSSIVTIDSVAGGVARAAALELKDKGIHVHTVVREAVGAAHDIVARIVHLVSADAAPSNRTQIATEGG